ncbi:MAG: aldo/keto reductase [Anaerolineae bacterium]|jgi:predicted aldo/keto reductase-like oxidoreductase|nr:oxidoreductase [Chloroflexota bacterium]
MEYRTLGSCTVSRLGLGAMRLPTLGQGGPIDEPAARALIRRALEGGITYFDTAYRYHNGASELLLGQVLNEYPRAQWHLATKFPGHMMQIRNGRVEMQGYLSGLDVSSPATIFEDQLARCGVDYFDYYLLHNLCESSYDTYTDADFGVVAYLEEQRAAGRIRHLGFSSHGRTETIARFLDWRPDTFEFVQLQLNYLDWTLQDAAAKYALLAERGLPVLVMEPVRGGYLANPAPQAAELLRAARPEASFASWALRFVQDLPQVAVVLSGMSTLAQLEENLQLFDAPQPLSAGDRQVLQQVTDSLVNLVPCTACRYCCETCPQELDIPALIALYNELSFEPTASVFFALQALGEADMPANCIACEACMQVCPQMIEVPRVLAELDERITAFRAARPR